MSREPNGGGSVMLAFVLGEVFLLDADERLLREPPLGGLGGAPP